MGAIYHHFLQQGRAHEGPDRTGWSSVERPIRRRSCRGPGGARRSRCTGGDRRVPRPVRGTGLQRAGVPGCRWPWAGREWRACEERYAVAVIEEILRVLPTTV
ncbi:hypothetical protein HBB16_10940 [Pseudonocardia sp. MCCB 268]|nr:hypothetical protein [Pseudonocardia cytotoxica]